MREAAFALSWIAGAVAVTYGTHQAWQPLGWIVGGVLLIVTAYMLLTPDAATTQPDTTPGSRPVPVDRSDAA